MSPISLFLPSFTGDDKIAIVLHVCTKVYMITVITSAADELAISIIINDLSYSLNSCIGMRG